MRIPIIPILIVLMCCQPNKKMEETTHPLVGEWRNVTLLLEMDKKHGEPTKQFFLDEKTWEDSLQIRPIRTFFRADGTFNSEHYNLSDSLVLNPEGTWSVTEGEVLMITTKPFSDSTSCTYTIDGDVVTFGCWVDWDEDGEKDDWYVGTQKRY